MWLPVSVDNGFGVRAEAPELSYVLLKTLRRQSGVGVR